MPIFGYDQTLYDYYRDDDSYTKGDDIGLYATGETLSVNVVEMTSTKKWAVGDYTNKAGSSTLNFIQGSCTDGKYIYVLVTDVADGAPNSTGTGTNAPDQTRVIKIDAKTGTVVKVGPVISVAHANDITYKDGKILSAWCSGDAKRYTVINPDTLEEESQGTFTKNFFSIAYDPISDRFALAKSGQGYYGYALMIYKGDGTFVREFQTERFGYTAQGIFCDEQYIYYTQSNRVNYGGVATQGSLITVHDWDGNLVCVLRIDNNDEIESMFWLDGSFYACFNATGGDYIAQLSVKK